MSKPLRYKVICVSIYKDDLAMADAKVAELKARGHLKANRSWLIRAALRALDVSTLADGDV